MTKHKQAKTGTGKVSDKLARSDRGAMPAATPDVESTRKELLPSDMNESSDISPRIAFLAYN